MGEVGGLGNGDSHLFVYGSDKDLETEGSAICTIIKGWLKHTRQKDAASGPFQFSWGRAWQISKTTIMESQWIALLIWPDSALTHPKISTQRVKEIKTILDFPFKNLSRFALLVVIDLVLNHETYSYRWTASSASGSIIRVWWTQIEGWRYRWMIGYRDFKRMELGYMRREIIPDRKICGI